MNRSFPWRGLSAGLALTVMLGCGELEIINPNAPDAVRALSDPATVGAVVGGTLKSWMETHESPRVGLLMSAMADGYTASWNNWNMRYYSSYGQECPNRCGWQNNLTSSQYTEVESGYYGMYSALSSATDGVFAIRQNGVIINDAAYTKMIETIGVMMQGMALAHIALNYDQGFIVDETTDLTDPTALPLSTRAEVQAAAFAKLEDAYALAQANSFVTEPSWMGVAGGDTYTNTQIAKLIRTMQADLLASFPRNGAEVAAVNWGQVAQLASQGLDYTWGFAIDPSVVFLDYTKLWGNSNYTVRVDTRLAAAFPGGNQVTPWPDPAGNPQPNSPDKRVGDGSWGPFNNASGTQTLAATANAGTDFAWHGAVIFPSARGQLHQSNISHWRYDDCAYPGEGTPINGGYDCFAPIYTQGYNDLLWAEALLRSGGSKAQAATLINRTRVGRGGLSARTGGESTASLLDDVYYESRIETLGLGTATFYLGRRFDTLWPDTPRHKPIPARELGLLQLELYSFGGPGAPALIPGFEQYGKVKNVKQIAAEISEELHQSVKAGKRIQ